MEILDSAKDIKKGEIDKMERKITDGEAIGAGIGIISGVTSVLNVREAEKQFDSTGKFAKMEIYTAVPGRPSGYELQVKEPRELGDRYLENAVILGAVAFAGLAYAAVSRLFRKE